MPRCDIHIGKYFYKSCHSNTRFVGVHILLKKKNTHTQIAANVLYRLLGFV